MSHPWLPVSTCDASCVRVRPSHPVTRWLRVAVRTALVLAVLGCAPALWLPSLPLRRRYFRLLAWTVGVTVDGAPIEPQGAALIVAPHVSWLDVLVLSAVCPSRFVARADLVTWPVLGRIARWGRVIVVDRDRLRTLPSAVAQVTHGLRAGEVITVFPEATTWCGVAHGRLRPAFFEAALAARAEVLVTGVRYRAGGVPCTVPAFVADDNFGASLLRILGAPRAVARVRLARVLDAAADRRTLANRAEAALWPTVLPTWPTANASAHRPAPELAGGARLS